MQKQIHMPRDKGTLERTADIASGYILVAAILAMGLFGMACTLHLVQIDREIAIAARV